MVLLLFILSSKNQTTPVKFQKTLPDKKRQKEFFSNLFGAGRLVLLLFILSSKNQTTPVKFQKTLPDKKRQREFFSNLFGADRLVLLLFSDFNCFDFDVFFWFIIGADFSFSNFINDV